MYLLLPACTAPQFLKPPTNQRLVGARPPLPPFCSSCTSGRLVPKRLATKELTTCIPHLSCIFQLFFFCDDFLSDSIIIIPKSHSIGAL